MKSTVKKIGLFGIALILAWSCQAVDYDQHFGRAARVYRVGLGSGEAPSAADMKTVGIRPGDMVVNTDDGVLYIMQATNVYTKIDADGNMTLGFGITLNSTTITNVIGAGSVLPAVDYSGATNGSAASLAAGGVFLAIDASALTNITATVSLQTGTGYDATGAAITNAAGDTMAIVTNATVAINP